MPRSGFGGATTVQPCRCSRSTTPFQLEASAKAPCTRTMVGWVLVDREGCTEASMGEDSDRKWWAAGTVTGLVPVDAPRDVPFAPAGDAATSCRAGDDSLIASGRRRSRKWAPARGVRDIRHPRGVRDIRHPRPLGLTTADAAAP